MLELIITNDGSKTYRNTEVGATYRSTHGAISESRYVFLEGSKIQQKAGPWRVLELGFGTGMNFEVTRLAAAEAGVDLHYVSLEPHPLDPEQWLTETTEGLHLVQKRWQEHQPEDEFYDAVYHDPFGPGPSPECWAKECFTWSYRAIKQDGILATYGASTASRQAMKDAGFYVGTLLGAIGKREMTVASKSEEAISNARPWKRKKP